MLEELESLLKYFTTSECDSEMVYDELSEILGDSMIEAMVDAPNDKLWAGIIVNGGVDNQGNEWEAVSSEELPTLIGLLSELKEY